MDVISATHVLSSIESLIDTQNHGSVDRLPATKRLMELNIYITYIYRKAKYWYSLEDSKPLCLKYIYLHSSK